MECKKCKVEPTVITDESSMQIKCPQCGKHTPIMPFQEGEYTACHRKWARMNKKFSPLETTVAVVILVTVAPPILHYISSILIVLWVTVGSVILTLLFK